MPSDPKNPQIGDLSIDASALASFIIDLPPGGTTGFRRERPGIQEALTEISQQQKSFGSRAGIQDSDLTQLGTLNDRLAAVRHYLAPSRKLTELLEETEAFLDNERHRIISTIANTVDQRAKTPGNEDLASRYAATRAYRSAIAVKAQRTRVRNDKGDKEPQPGPTPKPSVGPSPSPQPS